MKRHKWIHRMMKIEKNKLIELFTNENLVEIKVKSGYNCLLSSLEFITFFGLTPLLRE